MILHEKDIDEKKLIFGCIIGGLAVLIVIMLIAVAVNRSGNTNAEDYPQSTLDKIKMASTYTKDERLPETLACPTIPYLVDVMEEIEVTSDGSVLHRGGSYNFVMKECGALEKTDTVLYSLNLEDQKYVEDPKVLFDKVIEDKGYANGYPAYYLTGHIVISTRLQNYHKYGALYRIVTGENTDLLFYVYSDSLQNLNKHKDLLDAVVGTLTPDQERMDINERVKEAMNQYAGEYSVAEDGSIIVPEGSTELIDALKDAVNGTNDTKSKEEKSSNDTVSESKSETYYVPHQDMEESSDVEHIELEDGSYGTVTTDANGVKTYEKNKPFTVSDNYVEMCVHYWWTNDAAPLSVTLIGPDGTEYTESSSDSDENDKVFIVTNNQTGEYILKVRTRDTLENTGIEVMELSSYRR